MTTLVSPILATATSVHQTEQVVFYTFLQIIAILAAARAAGTVAGWLKQPRVVGEIIGGLILGPSLVGRWFPGMSAALFPSDVETPLAILSQIGLILLMFHIGMEFDFSHLKDIRNLKAVTWVSVAGIIVPFAMGAGIALWSHGELAADKGRLGYTLFMAVAMSITAIPILGRIMIEFGLTRTRMGTVAISAAAINDVVGWVLLALISAMTISQFTIAGFAWELVLLAVYFVVCWWPVRWFLRWLLRRYQVTADRLPHGLMAIILGMIFLSGLITFKLGIFAIFGGFMMGVLLHDQLEFVAAWRHAVTNFVTVFFLPIFFTFTGLRTNINALDSASLWGWCGVITLAAYAGKFLGCGLAARTAGMSLAESGCIGIMMNTRALMELIVVNVGYELGVIPTPVFTMLVLMAIASTLTTAPVLYEFLKRMGHKIPQPLES
jgi:Kef-type K+ transport system membrane component KefB